MSLFFFDPSLQVLVCADPSGQAMPVLLEVMVDAGMKTNGVALLPRAPRELTAQLRGVVGKLRRARTDKLRDLLAAREAK